jgi:hypothetical protein
MAPGPQARESDCVRPQRLAEISPYDDQCLETREVARCAGAAVLVAPVSRLGPWCAADAGRTPFTRRSPGGNVRSCCQNAQTAARRTICWSRPRRSNTQIMAATRLRCLESSRHLATPFTLRVESASSLRSRSCPAGSRSIEASAAAINAPRRAGRPHSRPPMNGLRQRWQVCMGPPRRHGRPPAAATGQERPSTGCCGLPLVPDAMGHAASSAEISLLPRSVAGPQAVSFRAYRRRRQLDAALAQGADPWSAPELMVRASRLGSLSERRKGRGRAPCTRGGGEASSTGIAVRCGTASGGARAA